MLISYDSWLVVLSITIAVFASHVALNLATRIAAARRTKAAQYWLAGGALSMGTGIWSEHFIGMLAVRLPVPVTYDVSMAVLALLVGIATSGLALKVVSGGALHWSRLLFAGTTMGAGIAALHTIGVASMKMQPAVTHDPWLFLTAALIAVVASTAALTVSFQAPATTVLAAFRSKLGGAALMGAGIGGMHYTAMGAAIIVPGSVSLAGSPHIDHLWLGGIVGAFVFVLLAATLVISACDAHFGRRSATYARELRAANATLQAQAEELSRFNLLLQKEVQERMRSEKEIEYLAHHDTLTGLPNRRLFSRYLVDAIRDGRRYSKELAVLFVDLDRFKTINDTMGHEAGDLLLQDIGRRLRWCLRPEHILARFGGDEFVLLLPELHEPSSAAAVADKILTVISEPLVVHGQEFHVTASVGISTFPKDGRNEQTLMKHADIAMYQAKEAGKSRFRYYSGQPDGAALDRLSLETRLRQAVDRGEFELRYQPKVDLVTGQIVGVEALLRWQQPQLGNVSPTEFIPLAEETGLIVKIGKWALETACRQGAAWHKLGYGQLGIAVNLSARQLADDRLAEDVAAIIDSSGIDPACLELEITESVVMRDVGKALTTLRTLKSLGLRFALDDFGTGHSSLSILKQFPIDTLKIDGAFVKGIPANYKDNGIAEAIIAMGRSLDLTVVAEAVETADQVAFLRARACHQFQGYYFSAPVTADQLETMLGAPGSTPVAPANQTIGVTAPSIARIAPLI
jgi:diguanylate cyclase (GGDEF)-like protein